MREDWNGLVFVFCAGSEHVDVPFTEGVVHLDQREISISVSMLYRDIFNEDKYL